MGNVFSLKESGILPLRIAKKLRLRRALVPTGMITGLIIIRTPPLRIFSEAQNLNFSRVFIIPNFSQQKKFRVFIILQNCSKFGLSGGWFLDKLSVSALIYP